MGPPKQVVGRVRGGTRPHLPTKKRRGSLPGSAVRDRDLLVSPDLDRGKNSHWARRPADPPPHCKTSFGERDCITCTAAPPPPHSKNIHVLPPPPLCQLPGAMLFDARRPIPPARDGLLPTDFDALRAMSPLRHKEPSTAHSWFVSLEVGRRAATMVSWGNCGRRARIGGGVTALLTSASACLRGCSAMSTSRRLSAGPRCTWQRARTTSA